MAGVVVGVRHGGASGAAVRWASTAAELRALPLTVVHVWHEALEVTVDLDPGSLPDAPGPVTCRGVPGPAALALLAQRPDLLVLGGHYGAPHLTHLARTCLHQASCPVVVVPDSERPVSGRVVVGVCSTTESHVALCWALQEARMRRAELRICYAWQAYPTCARDVLHPVRALPVQRRAASDRISAWLGQIQERQHIEVDVIQGGPLDGLLKQGEDADLIVLGRSEHTGLSRLLHSAVGDDLSGLAPCPVAVIPPSAPHGPRASLGRAASGR